jgi:hypothetical protein
LAVESLESRLGLVDGAELDVAESLGSAGVAVSDEVDTLDVTVLAEQLVQGV